jgi:hypothetical protein
MHTCEKFTKIWNDKQVTVPLSGERQAGGLDRNSSVQEVAMLRSLKITGWNPTPNLARLRPHILFQNFLIASKHPHNSLHSYSSLVVSVTFLTHLEYQLQWSSLSVNQPSRSSPHVQTRDIPHLQGRVATEFKEGGRAWYPDHRVRPIENIFSVVCTNWSACLNIFDLEANEVTLKGDCSFKIKVRTPKRCQNAFFFAMLRFDLRAYRN